LLRACSEDAAGKRHRRRAPSACGSSTRRRPSNFQWRRPDDRTKRIAARAPDLDIFSQAFVTLVLTGWQITAAGREFLASVEKPAPPLAAPVAASIAVTDPVTAPLIGANTRRHRRRRRSRGHAFCGRLAFLNCRQRKAPKRKSAAAARWTRCAVRVWPILSKHFDWQHPGVPHADHRRHNDASSDPIEARCRSVRKRGSAHNDQQARRCAGR
jgi:hypothetical protein